MSVHKTRAGRWEVRWRQEGRQRSRQYDHKRDADTFEADVRRHTQPGAHAPSEASVMVLDAWLARWWTHNSSEWSANTRRMRRSVVERWIVSYLGQTRLRDLGTARVKQWRTDIQKAGAPATQVNNALSVLSAALGRAVEDGLLPSNPCAPVRKIGRPAPTHPRALTPREIEAIRAELSGQADKVVWGLMAYAGLRPSEALAVRWGDLDGSLLVVDAMKTLRRRVVDVIGPLQDDLGALRPREAERGELVATSPQGLPISLGNWRQRVFLPACGRAGIDADPKDGRTSCISLMVHEGRSLAYVAASMGNSARVISDNYLHVLRAAELGARMPMADAVYEARGAGDVRQMFGGGVVLPFRRASQRDKRA